MPICNRDITRGFEIYGFVFPFCYRCTGVILAAFFILTWLFFTRYQIKHSAVFLIIGIVLILPTGIDGVAQYGFGIISNNVRRFSTAIVAGLGYGMVLYRIATWGYMLVDKMVDDRQKPID